MHRFRVELVLSAVFVVLAAVTYAWPAWIESLSGSEPDGGNGNSEWLLVAVFAIAAVVSGALAYRDRAASARTSSRSW